ALSAGATQIARGGETFSENGEAGVVPGRTTKHGRVVVYRAAAADLVQAGDRLCRTPRQRQSRGGRSGSTQTRASAVSEGRVYGVIARRIGSRVGWASCPPV